MGGGEIVPVKFRLRAFDVFGAPRGVVPEWAEIEFTDKLNDLPTLSVKIAAGSLAEERLRLPVEVALEVSWDGGETWTEPGNARFISTGVDRDAADPGEYVTLPFLGFGVVLRWATVWDPTVGAGTFSDLDGSNPKNDVSKRVFDASSPGKIVHDLFEAAKARRDDTGLAWGGGTVSWRVSSGADSGGEGWGKNANPTFSTSDTLEKVVSWLAGKGALDWRFEGREFAAYRDGGGMSRDRRDKVFRAVFSTALPRRVDLQNVATVARFRGDNGFTKTMAGTGSYRGLGRIEKWSEQGQVSTDATARLYLEEVLQAGRAPAVEWRREWNTAVGAHIPLLWRDYTVGDWVSTGVEDLRVVEAGVRVSPSGEVTGWETLGTRIQSLLERLARKTTDLSSGMVGSDSGRPAPPGEDTRIPAAPDGVVVSSDVVVEREGWASGVVTVSWHPVTTASNGTSMDVTGYEVQWRESGSGTWRDGGAVEGANTQAGFWALPGAEIAVRVRAVKGDRPGLWSAEVGHIVETDSTPPPVPSTPTVNARLGVIRVEWDGQGADGAPMPPDFSHLDVEVVGGSVETDNDGDGDSDGGVVVAFTAGGNVWQAVAPTPGDYRVRVRSVDRAGNTSAWCEPVGVTVKALVDTGPFIEGLEGANARIEEAERARAAADEELAARLAELSEARADGVAQAARDVLDEWAASLGDVDLNTLVTGAEPPTGQSEGTVWQADDGKYWKKVRCDNGV